MVFSAIYAVDEATNKVIGSCANDSCARAAPFLLFGSIFLFGGPAWWTISGARTAGRLTSRQLAWLVAVDVYLVVIGLFLWTQARDHVDQTPPLSEVLTLVAGAGLMSTAVLSAVACARRMVHLARPTASPL